MQIFSYTLEPEVLDPVVSNFFIVKSWGFYDEKVSLSL